MNNKKEIAFFDFDGTVISKDSMYLFLKFSSPNIITFYYKLILFSPYYFLLLCNIISNQKAKEKLISFFFKNKTVISLNKKAKEFSLNIIDEFLIVEANKKIDHHLKEGHEVVVVSASLELWLKDWCEKRKVKLIATKLEMVNGSFSGKMKTKNCYGIEKVNRIKQQYQLTNYETIYCYGDSIGDTEMLAIGHKKYYRKYQ